MVIQGLTINDLQKWKLEPFMATWLGVVNNIQSKYIGKINETVIYTLCNLCN